MKCFGVLSLLGLLLVTRVAWGDEREFSSAARERIAELEREITLLKSENKQLTEALEANGIQLGEAQQTIVTILRELPEDLQPTKSWDKYTRPAVYEWLEAEMTGAPFETVLNVSKVKVGRNPYNSDPSAAWRASIYFKPRQLRYGKKLFTETVGENRPQPLHLDGDEEFARAMEAIPVGKKARVTGKIAAVQLSPTTKDAFWNANISLRDYKVEFLK